MTLKDNNHQTLNPSAYCLHGSLAPLSPTSLPTRSLCLYLDKRPTPYNHSLLYFSCSFVAAGSAGPHRRAGGQQQSLVQASGEDEGQPERAVGPAMMPGFGHYRTS